ncbi:unnamed protein product [Ixodes pacificus]
MHKGDSATWPTRKRMEANVGTLLPLLPLSPPLPSTRGLQTLESKLASCRNFVKSPQREDVEGLGAISGVAAAGRAHLKQRALSSPQEFVPLAF